RFGVSRVLFQEHGELWNRFARGPVAREQPAVRTANLDETRINSQHLGVMFDGEGFIANRLAGSREVVMDVQKPGVEAKRGLVVIDGLREMLQGSEREAPVAVGFGETR